MKSLTFKRRARAWTDGKNGVLYLFKWATGYDELVFDNHEAAAKWAKAEGAELKGVPVPVPAIA